MPNQPSRRNAKSPHNAQVFRAFSAQIYPLNSTKTLYKEQWLKLLDMSADIRAFIAANEAQLKAKD